MSNYQQENKLKDTKKLREILAELPPFLKEFFRGVSQTTSPKTRLGYAYDLRLFFRFLSEEHLELSGIAPQDLTLQDLNMVTAEDIDCFLEHLSYYVSEGTHTQIERHNDERGKSRKLSALRAMFKYFYKRGKITSNPASLIDTPKLHEKQIVRLNTEEMEKFLEEVHSACTLTPRQQARHQKTKYRDVALMTLLLGTGMRVSECVGINISDIDFENYSVRIIRKGGNEVLLYFGEEVSQALQDYLIYRQQCQTKSPQEDALFLSVQNKRISVRAVQNLVKKYAQGVTQKRITPHKLRSTYGTNLYHQTGDIYLVADALGHADVNTTRKHYAQIEESQRKRAASFIKLRQNQ